MEVNDHTLTELLRLTEENNKMLHKMRRGARWGIVGRIIWWALALGVPLWLYLTYIAPVLTSFNNAVHQLQTSSDNAQNQFSEFAKMWDEFRSKIPGLRGD